MIVQCPRCGAAMEHGCLRFQNTVFDPEIELWFWWCTAQDDCGYWIPSPGERATLADGPPGSKKQKGGGS